MSVIIPLEILKTNTQAKYIVKDLYVEQKTQQKGAFNITQSYRQGQKSVECFDSDGIFGYIPFSYTFHHLNTFWTLPNCKDISLKFEGKLLDRQKEIREETFEILNRTHSVLLCLHTGFGKTIYTLYLASKIGKKTLVLCHRKIIMDQWVASIKKYLPNTTVEQLKSNVNPTSDIVICNVLTIAKMPRSTYKEYGLVIIDEVHTICTEQFSKSLTMLCPDYLIGLSATPFRTDGMDRILELYIGPEIITRKMWRLFNFYRVHTGFVPDVKRQVDGTLDWNSVLESQATSSERNTLIVNLVRFFCNRVILVLVKRKDHAITLKNELIEKGVDTDVFFGTAKTANYKCRVLIATYSKGGVGFDHPELDMLITAADVEENFMQYLGRIFRKDNTTPIYLDLIDKLSTISRHSTTRNNICREIGGTMYDFNKVFPDFNLFSDMINRHL